MATLTPVPKIQFFDANGNPLAGGKLYSYDAGTTTPRSTYTDYGGGTPNANPVILDSRGEANVWLDSALYKLKLTSATDVEIWTVDNVGGAATLAQLAASGGSALVGFIQAGTGAVTRTAQAKMRDAVSVKDFGAVGDGVADDTAEIQAAIDYATSIGGQTVACGGLTYKTTGPIIVKDDVKLDLQGGKILSVLSGMNDYGVRLRNRAELCNGEIEVQSSGSPGSQSGIHSPVLIGPLYGDGGTVASPSVDADISNWTLRNLRLHSNKPSGAVGIQIIGSANNGLIENIEVPDSSVMFGGVHLDWGTVGDVNSSDVPGTRTRFNAGLAYTRHPNNIRIRNIKIGVMSRPFTTPGTGSDGIRFSGVHNITVENVFVESVTENGFFHTAGDLGYEFADNSVKAFAHKDIRVSNFEVFIANKGRGAYIDCFADNIAAAVSGSGYVPLLDPVCETNMVVEQLTTKGDNTDTTLEGFRVYNIRGLTLRNCDAQQHLNGILIDAGAERVAVLGGRYWRNRQYGGTFISSGTKPADIVFDGVKFDQNGQAAGAFAGLRLEWCNRPKVYRCKIGADGYVAETTQDYGLWVFDSSVAGADIQENYVAAVASGGYAYVLASTNAYGVLSLFCNNTAASAITNKIAGVDIIPINRFLTSDGRNIGHYTAQRVALSADTTPTAGTWETGDLIFHSNPTGSDTGTRCTAGGTPGTWGLF